MEKRVHIFCGPKLSNLPQQALLECSRNFLGMVSNEPITGEVEGLTGVRLDFNVGLRLQIPSGNWHVNIRDGNSGIVCFDGDVSDILLVSAEKYFIPWEIVLSLDGETVFTHRYSAEGQLVCFHYFETGLGDHIVLFSYMENSGAFIVVVRLVLSLLICGISFALIIRRLSAMTKGKNPRIHMLPIIWLPILTLS